MYEVLETGPQGRGNGGPAGQPGMVAGPLVEAPFEDARTALVWSVEVLRRKRLPRLSAIWDQMGDLGGSDDRYSLALDVLTAVHGLDHGKPRPGHGGALLLEQAWGDWLTDAWLRGALAMQEKLRRQGVRMLVNHRYTFRQLSLQQTLYALANNGLDASEANQYKAALQSQSQAAAADAQRQSSLMDYYTRLNAEKAQSPFSAVLRTSLGSIGVRPGLSLGSWRF